MSTDGVLTHRGLRSAVHVKVEKCCKGVASNRKVLIVDERSSLFLSRAMKVHELMECNILLIEDIKKVRQPLPNSVALYFITTDVESIDHLIQDWDGSGSPPRKYLEAHVFFLCRVSDITVERICVALGTNLKSLRELLLSFSVVDRFFYEVESSGGTLALCCCAVPHNATAAMKDIAPSRFEFSKEALSLTSVLHTLGDKSAVVRYLNRPICRAFAEQLMETLTVVAQLDEELAQRDASPPESTTEVLILDRSLDWTNPLMHDLTYSAFLNDVMPLAGMRTTVESERKDGTRSVKEYLIDDEDAVWTRLRYEHLGDANREIHQELRSLMETQNRGNGRGGDAAVSKMTISELTQAVHRIPEIQQQSARLSVHVDLLSRLNQHFKERKLETPISLEQKIITRHASVDGPKVSEKEIEAELIPFLQNDTYSTAERSRVLLLYAMTLGGDMKRLRELVVKTANMKIDERLLELCATQLTHDAWKLSTEGEKRLKNALKKKGDKNKKGKDGAATMLYDLSRSVPIIRTVAQLLTRGLLPEETFPRVADIAATGRNPTEGLHGGKPAAIAPTSLRKATAATSWANPFRQGKQTTPMRTIEVTASHTMKVQGPRYVLFILGGLTYSEMKHIHDVISEESVEMYAGGTTSLSPDEFLRALHEKATTL